jgi:hypothetical protein
MDRRKLRLTSSPSPRTCCAARAVRFTAGLADPILFWIAAKRVRATARRRRSVGLPAQPNASLTCVNQGLVAIIRVTANPPDGIVRRGRAHIHFGEREGRQAGTSSPA